jgi:hypothetical protein
MPNPNQFTLLKHFFERHQQMIVVLITICLSVFTMIYFYTHGMENLSNYDAMGRLNLVRKLIDSLTPGVGQFGAIWLPLPQILMLPFIWNNFLWHSGLAGAAISMPSFVIGALYLQKTAFLLTKNTKASLLVWFMFVTNINVLLFQTMPMSESFFLFCIIMVLYFLTKWAIDHDIVQFLAAAFFVMLGTLTRYEGYFILVGAVCAVFIELVLLYWKKRNFAKIEGMMLVFLTIATYGIFLWCFYCFIFFKDPLHWLHLYANDTNGTMLASQLVRNGIFDSFRVYSEITLWMSGLVNSFLGLIGFITLIIILLNNIRNKRKINQYLPVAVVTIVLFPILVYGYQKGNIPHVTFEAITMQHILSKSYNFYPPTSSDAPNIRYGLIMVPFIALFTGFFAAKRRILLLVALSFICFQLYTDFYTPLLLQFSIPKASHYSVLPSALWLKDHYDHGLILTSASTNENFIFQTGLSYNHFIYDGTRQYWTTSLKNPARYATWVMYETSVPGDTVYASLTPSGRAILNKKFKLVYSDYRGYRIYHLIK